MKKINLLFMLTSSLLIACGGGGGGGKAAEGGFGQADAPSVNMIIKPETFVPGGSGIIDVFATHGNTPIETGTGDKSEVYVNILNTGTVDAVLHCFEIGDRCTEEVTVNGVTTTRYKSFGGMNVNLNGGAGSFQVVTQGNSVGYVDLRISVKSKDSPSTTVKNARIPVKFPSSGRAYQLNISAPNVINPNVANKFSVIATDESGNPITDAKQNNLLVTATGLNGVVLGDSGKTGTSLFTKTKNGAAVISLLANQVGTVKITAQADGVDNNLENGIQQLVETTKFIQVNNDKIIPLGPINITTGSLPNGAVNVKYDFTIPTAGAALSNMTVESGSVPPGLTLSSAGQLTGTPVLAGDYKFTVKATGVNNTTASKTISLKIVTGGLKFNPTGFKKLQIPAQYDCIVTSQPVIVESTNNNYKPQLPFKWHYDAGEVKTALNAGTATPLKDANGKTLTGLEITVTADTSQITMNGEACRGANITGGYGIILGVEDANGIKFETIMPLVIGADPKPAKPVEPVEPVKPNPELSLPAAVVGQKYNQAIPKATDTYTGSLPKDITLKNGTLSGVPTQGEIGGYSIDVTLTDGTKQVVKFEVQDATSLNATFTVGVLGSYQVKGATKLTKPSNFPSSLTVEAATAQGIVITGTPVAGDEGSYILEATLASGGTQTVNVTVSAAPTDGNGSGGTGGGVALPVATVGEVYPETYLDLNVPSSIITLPAGMSFSGGKLTGKPEPGTEGFYSIIATLSNDEKVTYSLEVKAAP